MARRGLVRSELHEKDIELALDAARRLGIPLPTADPADEVLELARTLGYEWRDLAALFQVLEQMTPQPTPAKAALDSESCGRRDREL